MPIEKIDGTDLSYFLIAFDGDGVERKESDGGLLSRTALQELASGGYTDLFVFSHGWKGDIPAAREQYERWTRVAASCIDDIDRLKQDTPNFRVLLIGLHWP